MFSAIQWQTTQFSGHDPLAARASKHMNTDELSLMSIAPSRLKWSSVESPSGGDYVAIRQLIEAFAKYIYLPRLLSLG
jgi:hypothetical protein